MKKKNGLITLVLVVASIAAITALIVANIEKICDFFDALKKKAKEACNMCCCDDDEETYPTDSDFEDVEL